MMPARGIPLPSTIRRLRHAPSAAPAAGRGWCVAAAAFLAAALPLGMLPFVAGTPGPPPQAAPLAATPLEAAKKEAPHDIPAAVETLAKQLAAKPDDAAGWAMLARSYTMLGELDKAEAASRHVAALRAKDPRGLGAEAEDLVVAAHGVVTRRARELFEGALAIDAADPRARFYLGLARAQAGEGRAALDDWLRLEADTRPDAPWLEGLRANIARLAGELGLDDAALAARRRLAMRGERK
jgi:cytochrome c-type biogenesis protein CcmH